MLHYHKEVCGKFRWKGGGSRSRSRGRGGTPSNPRAALPHLPQKFLHDCCTIASMIKEDQSHTSKRMDFSQGGTPNLKEHGFELHRRHLPCYEVRFQFPTTLSSYIVFLVIYDSG